MYANYATAALPIIWVVHLGCPPSHTTTGSYVLGQHLKITRPALESTQRGGGFSRRCDCMGSSTRFIKVRQFPPSNQSAKQNKGHAHINVCCLLRGAPFWGKTKCSMRHNLLDFVLQKWISYCLAVFLKYTTNDRFVVLFTLSLCSSLSFDYLSLSLCNCLLGLPVSLLSLVSLVYLPALPVLPVSLPVSLHVSLPCLSLVSILPSPSLAPYLYVFLWSVVPLVFFCFFLALLSSASCRCL